MKISWLKRLKIPPARVAMMSIFLSFSAASITGLGSINQHVRVADLGVQSVTTSGDFIVKNRIVDRINYDEKGGNSSYNPVEANEMMPVGRGDLQAGHWVYQFDMVESRADEWPPQRMYMVEVFANNALKGSLFVKNTLGDPLTVEGATLQVDLGAGELPPAVVLKVHRVADEK